MQQLHLLGLVYIALKTRTDMGVFQKPAKDKLTDFGQRRLLDWNRQQEEAGAPAAEVSERVIELAGLDDVIAL